MINFKINGLILDKKNIKEKSAIVYILTQELGVIKAKIDGINKPESKLLSVIQPGSYGRFFISSELNFFKILSFLPFKIPLRVFKKYPYTYLFALRFLLFFEFYYTSQDFFNYIINLDIQLLRNKKTFLIWYLNIIFKELGIYPNLTNCYRCGIFLSKKIYYKGSKFFCYKCRKLGYEQVDYELYTKFLFYLNKDKIFKINDDKLIKFIKKIFINHLKEIKL
ncbi:MAG: hypothetical protein KatS3mg095_0348 [Candidatus Parcubacteria bacterium]|nr:MAG: hypothetical protein KatS3mg095_0348 [Candidatus Parcubacteria bacterium]